MFTEILKFSLADTRSQHRREHELSQYFECLLVLILQFLMYRWLLRLQQASQRFPLKEMCRAETMCSIVIVLFWFRRNKGERRNIRYPGRRVTLCRQCWCFKWFFCQRSTLSRHYGRFCRDCSCLGWRSRQFVRTSYIRLWSSFRNNSFALCCVERRHSGRRNFQSRLQFQ